MSWGVPISLKAVSEVAVSWDSFRHSEMPVYAVRVRRYIRLVPADQSGEVGLRFFWHAHGRGGFHLSLVGVVLVSALLVVEDPCPEFLDRAFSGSPDVVFSRRNIRR